MKRQNPGSGGDKKARAERVQTDESLRGERHRTDEVLAAKRRHTQVLADGVIERAREQADEVLDEAREKADEKLGQADPEGAAHVLIEQERTAEDEALKQERAAADEDLHSAREQQTRALAALLPLEREKTDRYLLTERARSDEAVSHRDDFMGMVSHDLRNLLAGIAVNAQLVAAQAPDSDEGARTLVRMDRIERYVARMNRLIGDLVDVASIDAGKLSVHPLPGNATELVEEAITPFLQSAGEKGITLGTTTGGSALPAFFDGQRMLQVLTNLIANALRFTPPGGTITVEARPVADGLRLSVLDTGEGIAEGRHEAIFDRFCQESGNHHGGLGLGLYISKCLVEAQGGRIWAEHNPGGIGSAFHLTMPCDVSSGDRKAAH